jgi:drug/metabolite transporter (DMT)-like permease
LATPVVGIAISTLVMGEAIDHALIAAMTMIVTGIAIGTMRWRSSNDSPGQAG